MNSIQKKIQQARTQQWKQLDLGNAGLIEVPPQVFDLDALEFLVLGSGYYDRDRNAWVGSENQGPANQITLIPSEITRLGNLAALSLSSTQVSDLTPLQGLTSLVSLSLSGTQVNDLTPLQGLTSLVSLNLHRTQVSDLTPLQGLTSLASLNLYRTQVSDLKPLASLTDLQTLDISRTQVSDLSVLVPLGDFRKRSSYDRMGILKGFFRNEPPASTHEVQSCACRT